MTTSLPPETLAALAELPELSPAVNPGDEVFVRRSLTGGYVGLGTAVRYVPFAGGVNLLVKRSDGSLETIATDWMRVGSVHGGPRPVEGQRVVVLEAPTPWLVGKLATVRSLRHEFHNGPSVQVDETNDRFFITEWALIEPAPEPLPPTNPAVPPIRFVPLVPLPAELYRDVEWWPEKYRESVSVGDQVYVVRSDYVEPGTICEVVSTDTPTGWIDVDVEGEFGGRDVNAWLKVGQRPTFGQRTLVLEGLESFVGKIGISERPDFGSAPFLWFSETTGCRLEKWVVLPETGAPTTPPDPDWMAQESERARKRIASLPPHARPVITRPMSRQQETAPSLITDRMLDRATAAAISDLGWEWNAEPGVPSPMEAMRPTIKAALEAAGMPPPAPADPDPAVVQRVVDRLLDQTPNLLTVWDQPRPMDNHSEHGYWAWCALCRMDLPESLPLVVRAVLALVPEAVLACDKELETLLRQSIREARASDRRMLAYLLDQYDATVAIHAGVGMDTDEDRELHRRAVESMREAAQPVRAYLALAAEEGEPDA